MLASHLQVGRWTGKMLADGHTERKEAHRTAAAATRSAALGVRGVLVRKPAAVGVGHYLVDRQTFGIDVENRRLFCRLPKQLGDPNLARVVDVLVMGTAGTC